MGNLKTSAMAYSDFLGRLALFAKKNPKIITNTLSNIFSMRTIGNKTHGDLAEIGISEFINQFMYDYNSIHVGKDLFRSKSHEEDIVVNSLVGSYKDIEIPISLKAYGVGPLQISTDKDQVLYKFIDTFQKKNRDKSPVISNKNYIKQIINSETFATLYNINIIPLVYNEKDKECNIMIFDMQKALASVSKIIFIDKNQIFDAENNTVLNKKGRKHPIYCFLDKINNYLFEIRYGDASANALQRGCWTHTEKACNYFNSITGWISYSNNDTLVQLFSLALVSTQKGHIAANKILQQDIEEQKHHAAK